MLRVKKSKSRIARNSKPVFKGVKWDNLIFDKTRMDNDFQDFLNFNFSFFKRKESILQ